MPTTSARRPRRTPATDVRLVLVTAPDLPVARRLACGALAARLIACANLVPRLESHYVWQGQVEQANEVLLVLKTTRQRIAALEAFILAEHPYDTAEFLVLPVEGGAGKYLAWVAAAVAG